MTLLATYFLPSAPLINMYIVYVYTHTIGGGSSASDVCARAGDVCAGDV